MKIQKLTRSNWNEGTETCKHTIQTRIYGDSNITIIWFYKKNKKKGRLKTFKSVFLSQKSFRLKINRHAYTYTQKPSIDHNDSENNYLRQSSMDEW